MRGKKKIFSPVNMIFLPPLKKPLRVLLLETTFTCILDFQHCWPYKWLQVYMVKDCRDLASQCTSGSSDELLKLIIFQRVTADYYYPSEGPLLFSLHSGLKNCRHGLELNPQPQICFSVRCLLITWQWQSHQWNLYLQSLWWIHSGPQLVIVSSLGAGSGGTRSKFFDPGWVSHLWFGLGKFPLKIQKISIFALWVGSKSTWVKDNLASYLLRVKSMLGLGWVRSGPISRASTGLHLKFERLLV